MKLFVTYIWIQIKRIMKEIPYMVAGAAVLMFFIGTVVFCAAKLLYKEDESPKLQLGGIMMEDDKFGKMAANMLESMESIRTFCEVSYYYDREEAMEQMQEGNLDVVIELHEGYYDEIMNGIDNPIVIYLSDRTVNQTELFRMMSDTGSMVLSAAQVSSYAAEKYCLNHDLTSVVKDVTRAMDDENMRMFFKRDIIFQVEHTSATGKLSVPQYYAVSAVALFLLLLGIPCVNYAAQKNGLVEDKLVREGMCSAQLVLAKWMAMVVAYILVTVLIAGLVGVVAVFGLKMDILLQWKGMFSVLIAIILTTCLIMFIYEAADHMLAGVMVVFLMTFVCMYISGAFVPVSFLPDKAARLGSFMPTKTIMNLIVPVFCGKCEYTDWLQSVVWCLFFYGGTVLLKTARRNKFTLGSFFTPEFVPERHKF